MAVTDMGVILVTGSAGFIGGETVRHLRSLGATVVPATRDGSGDSRKLDMRDPASMAAALTGVGAVVNCVLGDRAVMVDGMRALLAAAIEAGVGRVVHVSSMSVYGGAQGVVTEDTPLVSPTEDGYAGWKSASEQVCLEQGGMRVVRLRPTIVYGPGGYWLDSIVRRIRSGHWATLGPAGEGTCNLVHVSDVAGAIAASLASTGGIGRAFNVNGPETTTWNDYFSRLAACMGAPALPARSPAALRVLMAASVPLKLLAKLKSPLGRNFLLGVPGRSELGLFATRATYPTDAAREALGWVPAMSIEQGLSASQAFAPSASR